MTFDLFFSGGDSMPIPFESQFFHDDVDDAFVDDNLDIDQSSGIDVAEEDDLWQGTQGQELKKSRPENVHFAKKAKRVDVKRLKDDIWTGLRTLAPEPKTDSEDDAVSLILVFVMLECIELCSRLTLSHLPNRPGNQSRHLTTLFRTCAQRTRPRKCLKSQLHSVSSVCYIWPTKKDCVSRRVDMMDVKVMMWDVWVW